MICAIMKKVKIIPIWVWLITLILAILFSISSYDNCLHNSKNVSFLDLLYSQINDIDMVSIPLIIMFLPLYGTGLGRIQTFEYNIIKTNNKFKLLRYIILYYAIIVVIYFILIYLVNILIFIIKGGNEVDINNYWSNNLGIFPAISIPLSFLLICFRFIFLSLLAFFFDCYYKRNPLGFISAIIVGWIDGFTYYYLFRIDMPLGILPIENSRIEYTPAWGIYENLSRVPYINSILYWIILISIMSILLYIKIRKKEISSFVWNKAGEKI